MRLRWSIVSAVSEMQTTFDTDVCVVIIGLISAGFSFGLLFSSNQATLLLLVTN